MSSACTTTRAPAGLIRQLRAGLAARRRAIPALAFLLLSLLASRSAADPGQILAPSLGRPVFVAPGAAFPVHLVTTRPEPGVRWALVPPGRSGGGIPLQVEVAPGAEAGPVRLRVPAGVPSATYDLEARVAGEPLRVPHCVAVGPLPSTIRLVHLSDMDLGDLTAPRFDRQLVDEVNLLAPTAIVCTGGYLSPDRSGDRRAWQQLIADLRQFDAPLIMAAGQGDNIAQYSSLVSPSPVGLVEIGRYRCLVLYDHDGAPLAADAGQLAWIDRQVQATPPDSLTLCLANRPRPDLLRIWHERGVLSERIAAGRIGVWLAGGHTDWDGQAHAGLVAAARPLLYLQTHQASSATLGGATGRPHYRVLDLTPQGATLIGDGSDPRRRASLPVGLLTADLPGRGDGAGTEAAFEIRNGHAFPADGLQVRVRVARTGTAPWCLGGTIVEQTAYERFWECRVRCDVPARGLLRGLVGTGPRTWEPLQVSAVPSADRMLVDLSVRNPGAAPQRVQPEVRLAGQRLPVLFPRGSGPDLVVPGGGVAGLRVDLTGVRVAAGRSELQVYLHGTPVLIPYRLPLE